MKIFFFDSNNPFINKLSDEQKLKAEGKLDKMECLNSLKNMKNGKSPGLDGFTTEFYKFFWIDLNEYLINSFNYSLENGFFSISQRQGLITCIPKEGKSKHYMKNWRPITLLNVDFKIASAALANRIKPFLKHIVSETQQGFIKGRYIGECTRLIFDLIEKAEDEDIPGLLVLLDFEKAFDTLEWSFINKALNFLGFGPVFCQWVKSLYLNTQSCIINNGHCSNFFNVYRGVRQGDPLSPYLFILSLELMSAAIKYDPHINGMKINNSEYLLSQYADDSSLILDGEEESLARSLYILEKFAECAGLRANLEKTEAIWIGSKVNSNDKLLPNQNLTWNQSGKFKLLGIKYELFEENKTLINFEEKIVKIKALLNSWIYRDLTYIGKITVIKSLALPIIIQSLTVLPNPPSRILTEIQNIFFSFVWSQKPDKIKRKVLIGLYETGGLKMPHVQSFCFALKMTWINKLLDPLNMSPWKTMFIDQYNKFGADKIWLATPSSIKNISTSFNSFWQDIFMNWSILYSGSQNTPDGILSQSIWLNDFLKINNKTVFHEKWCQTGVFFINDLLGENNKFMSFQEFSNTFNLNINFLHYQSIIHTIPKSWKEVIQNATKSTHITSENFEYVKKNKKCCQYFYRKYLFLYSEPPLKQQRKWCEQLDMEIEDWETIYQTPFQCTKNNKYIIFQYKILHRILSTNSLLYKCRLKETHLCSFCNETKETILHLFWDCCVVKNLWLEISELFQNRCSFFLCLTERNVILGSETADISDNLFIVLIKYYIYSCRFTLSQPCLTGAIKMLKHAYNIEKLSTSFYRSPAIREKTEQKWNIIANVLK